jgi:hypothetical protein
MEEGEGTCTGGLEEGDVRHPVDYQSYKCFFNPVVWVLEGTMILTFFLLKEDR